MSIYLDTSAFLKLVIEEEYSADMRAFCKGRDDELFSSDLLVTEALRTARRHSAVAVRETRRRLDALAMVRLTRSVCERAADLDPGIMRSLDALHLAGALALADDLDAIATYDKRLADAAALHGVATVAPGE